MKKILVIQNEQKSLKFPEFVQNKSFYGLSKFLKFSADNT